MAPSSASSVSARMLALSRPPVVSSPLPSSMCGPRPPGPRVRATSASACMLTTLARSFASWPSGRSGWLWNSAEVITTPRTESPRNSSRSLVGRPPFSYAYERWVSARSSRSGSNGTPKASSRDRVGGRRLRSLLIGHLGSGNECSYGFDRGAAVQVGGQRDTCGQVGAGRGAVTDDDRAGDAEQGGRPRRHVGGPAGRFGQRVRGLEALEQHVA